MLQQLFDEKEKKELEKILEDPNSDKEFKVMTENEFKSS